MSRPSARLLCRLALGCALPALLAGAAAADTTLHILHINDLHSRIEPVDKYDATCSDADDAAGKCFGGMARVASEIAALRAKYQGEPVLVLDAGDEFQGSLFYTTYRGKAAAELMNRIGFDAMAVGNHEFDNGPQTLADFADMVKFPVMSGNLDLTAEPRLAGRIHDHLVLDVGGLKIGLVGALTPETAEISSPGPNVKFEDVVAAMQADVDDLRAQGVTTIVALTHVGINEDKILAERVKGLAAVVGGHSHTLLSNSDPAAEGPYPVMVGTVPVVTARAYSRFVGDLALVLGDDGQVVSASGEAIPLDAGVPEDPAIKARVAELAVPLAATKAVVVGEATAPIDGSKDSCRFGECAMGDLVTDAMLSAAAPQGVTIAITNGGGLRASIDAGQITMGDVLTVLPFQNTLATFEASGAMIVAALENGVSQVEDSAGRFPQVAGLKFTWDPKVAPNQGRIRSVEVRQGEAWVPIDPTAQYLVASNNYMRAGGDGYKMFIDAAKAYDFGPGLEDVVADYIKAQGGAYAPSTGDRITRAE